MGEGRKEGREEEEGKREEAGRSVCACVAE